jgi:hypothetical protein
MGISKSKKKESSLPAKKITAESKASIVMHKQAAAHFEQASKLHSEAARHHEEDNHAKAHESALLASGHAYAALDIQKADAKHHALTR